MGTIGRVAVLALVAGTIGGVVSSIMRGDSDGDAVFELQRKLDAQGRDMAALRIDIQRERSALSALERTVRSLTATAAPAAPDPNGSSGDSPPLRGREDPVRIAVEDELRRRDQAKRAQYVKGMQKQIISQLDKLLGELDLTEDRKAEIRRVLQQWTERRGDLMIAMESGRSGDIDVMQQVEAMDLEVIHKIQSLLTPEQFRSFHQKSAVLGLHIQRSAEAPNEVSAVKALRSICEAEAVYKKAVNPGNYVLILADLVDNAKPMIPPDVQAGMAKGYAFVPIPCDENGIAYTATTGFAFCAYPATYKSTGTNTFIVNHQGIVYERDTGGAAVMQWPASDPTASEWRVSE